MKYVVKTLFLTMLVLGLVSHGLAGENNRMVPQGDGTVIDKVTGLQWMQCSVGQAWDGETCRGNAEEYYFKELDQAVETVNNRGVAGYTDWRMPMVYEMMSIIYCSISDTYGPPSEACPDQPERCQCVAEDPSMIAELDFPTINQEAFPNTAIRAYWVMAADEEEKWFVNFGLGNPRKWDFAGSSKPVRLVREPEE